MNLKRIINNGLSMAYKRLSSLEIDVTLNKKSSVDFNFNTAELTEDIPTYIYTKAIPLSRVRLSRDSSTVKQQLLLQTNVVGDIRLYDTITYDGYVWDFVAPISDDCFITVIDTVREA